MKVSLRGFGVVPDDTEANLITDDREIYRLSNLAKTAHTPVDTHSVLTFSDIRKAVHDMKKAQKPSLVSRIAALYKRVIS